MSRSSFALRLPATSMGMACIGWMLAASDRVRWMSPTAALPSTASAAFRAAAISPEGLVSLVCTYTLFSPSYTRMPAPWLRTVEALSTWPSTSPIAPLCRSSQNISAKSPPVLSASCNTCSAVVFKIISSLLVK